MLATLTVKCTNCGFDNQRDVAFPNIDIVDNTMMTSQFWCKECKQSQAVRYIFNIKEAGIEISVKDRPKVHEPILWRMKQRKGREPR